MVSPPAEKADEGAIGDGRHSKSQRIRRGMEGGLKVQVHGHR